MRSLDRDPFRPTVLGIVVVVCLLLVWASWFFLSELTLYEVSEAAQMVDGQRVTAEFPIERSLGRIRPGQSATLRLAVFSWVQYGTLSAKVQRVRTDTKSGTVHVELSLDDAESFPAAIESGSRGTVEIEVERISPAALVLRAAGKTAARPAQSGGR